MNIDPVNNPHLHQAQRLAGAQRAGVSPKSEGKSVGSAGTVDNFSQMMDKLRSTSEVRPEVVERMRQLFQSDDYPPDEVLDAVSETISPVVAGMNSPFDADEA